MGIIRGPWLPAPKYKSILVHSILMVCLMSGDPEIIIHEEIRPERLKSILFLATCYYLSYKTYWAFTPVLYTPHLLILQPYCETGIIRNYFIPYIEDITQLIPPQTTSKVQEQRSKQMWSDNQTFNALILETPIFLVTQLRPFYDLNLDPAPCQTPALPTQLLLPSQAWCVGVLHGKHLQAEVKVL